MKPTLLTAVALLGICGLASCATTPTAPEDLPDPPPLPQEIAPLVMKVLDVGQGDAIWIENGPTRVLIDAGQGMGRMADFIEEKGLAGDTIHWMILSHAHADHHGGMREFFKTEHGITVQRFLENRDPASGVMISELRDSIQAREARGELVYLSTDDPCEDGSIICTQELAGGGRMHILPPPASGHTNDRSVAVKLIGPDSASFSMLAAGDAEGAAMDHFKATYAANPGLDVTVLKGNHHGSCNGVTARWLELVNPEWTIWGVSSTNSYGHVHEQAKALHRAHGSPWLRSDENGRITFRTEGTPGSGYTVEVERGEASKDGAADRIAAEATCE
jgi:competence protein ComEC